MSQVSYIKYKDILEAHRYDAEYFKPEYLEIEKKLSSLGYTPLREYCNYIKKGIFDLSPSIYLTSGVPFIRTSEIKDPLIDFSSTVFLSEQVHKENYKTELVPGDLVFTKIGAYIGDVSMLPRNYRKYNFSQNVTGLSIKQDLIESGFILAYLLSKYGREQILRATMLSGQGKLELEDIRSLKVVNCEKNFRREINAIVLDVEKLKEKSIQLYREAEEILLVELGLLNYEVKNTLAFSVSKKEIDSVERFDSEYFQPKYKEIIKKIERYEEGWDVLKNVIDFKDKNFTPKESEKYKYLALSNISNQGYVQDYQEELGKNLPSRARRKVNTGDLIISSIEGSLSSCAIIEKEFDNSICSTGFFVLNSEKINTETLLILFKSKVIQELLQRGSKGTILTAISKTELEYIKVPLIKKSIQKQIAQKLQESYKLRGESKDLLEEAKRKVEEEVEN